MKAAKSVSVALLSDRRPQVALVTGGAIRLGAEIVRRLASSGYAVAIHYHRSGESARVLAAEIQSTGGCADLFCADLASEQETVALIERTILSLGGLDLLVCNAGLFFPDSSDERALSLMRSVNVEAPRRCLAVAVPHLAARSGAAVIIADTAAFVPLREHLEYSATKAELVEWSRAAALELAPRGVRVSTVCPGLVLPREDYDDSRLERLRTLIPLGRIGGAADVARAVQFLAESTFATGVVLCIDGGRHLLAEQGPLEVKVSDAPRHTPV